MTDLAPDIKPNLAVRDFMTKDGAEELVRRLRQFWDRERGGEAVMFAIEKARCPLGYSNAANPIVYAVRSNLIRGLPPS